MSVRSVQLGAARARVERSTPDAPPRPRAFWRDSVPLFPVGAFTPASACAHRGPIPRESSLYCPVCHQSGWDHLPYFRPDPRVDPNPEPKPEPEPTATTTRKQRRRRAQEQGIKRASVY